MKPRSNASANETKIYGVNACRTFFDKRPEDLVRVYLTAKSKRQFRTVMKFCVERQLAYHIRPKEELDKVCQSKHHEEVCFVIKGTRHIQVSDFARIAERGTAGPVLALDGVTNPHNLGALMRVCANFGVRFMLTENPGALNNASTMRTSEGGSEFVQVIACRSLVTAISELKKCGYRTVSTSSHRGVDLPPFRWPERTVLVLGSEATGVKRTTAEAADLSIQIEGTGDVESLNVACAASVLLYDYDMKRRRHT